MSMSSHVVFLRSKDNEEYQKMLKVKRVCDETGIEYPKEVESYFSGDGDYEIGEDVPLYMDADKETKEYNGDMEKGLEIKVSDIPKGVEVIRFYNSC